MAQKLPPRPQPFLPLGYTSQGKLISLTGTEFSKHKHVFGISGSGKSSLLAGWVIFLLRQGVPFILIDPHSDLTKLILGLLASGDFFDNERAYDKLWYVDFARSDSAIAFNVLNQPYSSHEIATNFLEVTKRAWPTVGATALMDNIIQSSCFVLAENNLPITSINRLVLDEEFRNLLLKNITDELVLDYFRSKFDGRNGGGGLTDSTLRRTFNLTFVPALRNALGQRGNKLNFREILDNGVSCLFNLGGLDDYAKRLVGCLLMAGIEQAFLSRADMPPEKRIPSHIIVDEFPMFSASDDSFTNMLEQVRKYKGTLYLAYQTTSQLSSSVAGSLQNAIGIIMKAGYEDSTWLAQRFVYQSEKQEGMFDMSWLFGEDTSNPFANMTTPAQFKRVFEALGVGEMIVVVNGQSVKLAGSRLPRVTDPGNKLQAIENTYAKRLLTPIRDIERGFKGSELVVIQGGRSSGIAGVVPSVRRAKRRME